MDSFLIVDGNSIMNRAFYGVMNGKMLATKEGIYTNAIYGFLNIYWMMMEKLNPNYVAVSFDLKAPTFRHVLYAEYKATRKPMPDELKAQMPLIKEVLTAMNVPILEIEGYEADDVLGTIAASDESKGIFTYILTGDRDSFQLISDSTSVVMPNTKLGKTEYTIYTPDALKEKYGITPEQVIEVKSLMGDSSDNIPGVKGIGEKTAYAMIQKYGYIDNIYNTIDSIDVTPKVKEKLVTDKEIAYISKTLATIDRNVPIDINYDKCILSDVNHEALLELFKKLEFSKFITKLNLGDASTIDNVAAPTNIDNNKYDGEIKKPPSMIYLNLENSEDKIKFSEILSIDKVSYFLNTGNYDKSAFMQIDTKFLAIYTESNDTIYIVKFSEAQINCLEQFSNSKSLKLGYNIKQDILYLFNNKILNINGFGYDLMIAYYLLDSNRTKYDISYIVDNLFNYDTSQIVSTSENSQISLFDDICEESSNDNKLTKSDENLLGIYLKCIYLSYNMVIEKLSASNMLELFSTIEMPLVETLAYMEYCGMYIDTEKLNEYDIELMANIDNLEKEIYRLADEQFNINSTQQLAHILFDKLKLPVKRKTKTGYSTDKEVLEDLFEYHEIIDKILEYRQIMKLKSTYVDGLRSKIDKDGRVHTTFMQTVASTGRLSSVEPNLQNIPVRIELGKKIRSFFVGEKDNVIVDADYSQIELRVLSHIANDNVMINAFNNNEDIHTVTASQVFNTNIADVTHEMRSKAKAVNFGIVYGISDFGLAKNVGSTRAEASEYIKNYLEKYSGIRKFMDDIVVEGQKQGYVVTLFNRRRYIPELSQKNKNIVQFGKRIAMNTPIQGSAADIIKLAMNELYKSLKENNLSSKLIMQVHDELIIESPPYEVDKVKEIMKQIMENVIKLKVPLRIDLNVGKSWYDTK